MFKNERRQPEKTLLYKIIEEYYPLFISQLAEQGRVPPSYVRQEFEAYLKCGILTHGFLRVRCSDCNHEKLVAFSCKTRGFCPGCGAEHPISVTSFTV